MGETLLNIGKCIVNTWQRGSNVLFNLENYLCVKESVSADVPSKLSSDVSKDCGEVSKNKDSKRTFQLSKFKDNPDEKVLVKKREF